MVSSKETGEKQSKSSVGIRKEELEHLSGLISFTKTFLNLHCDKCNLSVLISSHSQNIIQVSAREAARTMIVGASSLRNEK
jgi:hypothetical protein